MFWVFPLILIRLPTASSDLGNSCRFTDRDDDEACASLSPQTKKVKHFVSSVIHQNQCKLPTKMVFSLTETAGTGKVSVWCSCATPLARIALQRKKMYVFTWLRHCSGRRDILDASWSMKIMNGLGSRSIISCFGLIKQLNELRPRQVTEWEVSSHPWASKCHAERTASASQLSIPHTIFLLLHNRFTILIRSSTFDC